MCKTFLIFGILYLLLCYTVQAQNKKHEVGLFLGHGVSSLINSNESSYFTDFYNGALEAAPFYRINFKEQSFALKFEYTQRAIFSEYQFNNLFNARVSQAYMGVNIKGSYIKSDPSTRVFEFFGGVGLYTLGQKRTPNPISGINPINDGFAPYWGMSIEVDLSYSIPIDKYRVGMAWRVFALPNLTFFNRNGIPEFYHLGSTISLFTSF